MFRPAHDADLLALTELERDASTAALGHVFAPAEFPFPFDDVLARWRLVLDDPAVDVLVRDRDDAGGLLVHAAYDDRSLRHLAVHPTAWGRGLASAAITEVVASLAARGASSIDLWVLEENTRARSLYQRHGWRPAGESREAAWPPYPTETRYRLPLG